MPRSGEKDVGKNYKRLGAKGYKGKQRLAIALDEARRAGNTKVGPKPKKPKKKK